MIATFHFSQLICYGLPGKNILGDREVRRFCQCYFSVMFACCQQYICLCHIYLFCLVSPQFSAWQNSLAQLFRITAWLAEHYWPP